MHEASIALSILEIAEENCKKAGYGRVTSVGVKVGRASGVLPGALLLAFDVVKTGTIAAEATLLIEDIPLGGSCRACGGDFTSEERYVLSCPACGSLEFAINSGRELDIVEIEAE
jgi:hydrogenase nickel incorporation protein HypA/HybF